MNAPSDDKLIVAVTALNATDNPGPGVGVIRALREDPRIGRVVGLAYDSLEPGIYARELCDDIFLLPYPSQGVEALGGRLRYIKERTGINVIIPTLDSELPAFIALEPTLRELGIASFLPTSEQFDLRAKSHLAKLGDDSGIPVPRAMVLTDPAALYKLHENMSYPLVVKGLFYGAKIVRSVDEAVQAFHATVAQWGLPVIVQAYVTGEEFDVVAVGDGKGGMIGAVPMKKTLLTDRGKGWAGIAINDPELLRLTELFMKKTHWRGPCELEVIKSSPDAKAAEDEPQSAESYWLLEINPRFPAWCYLSAGAGMNLPAAVAKLAAGELVPAMTEFRVGTMFVRISIDQIAALGDLEQLASFGELSRFEPTRDDTTKQSAAQSQESK